jgi:hypothetical protein
MQQFVLFVPQIPSWSRHLRFTVNTKYYSIGTITEDMGKYCKVLDVTGVEFIMYKHQLVLLHSTTEE